MSDEHLFYEINKEIVSKLGRLMFSRPYLAIVDASGKIRYIDDELGKYKDYISEFTVKNFNLLHVGDYSIPLGGVNLAFFKPGNNFLIIIHSKKGPIGQLLSFKKIMANYTGKISELIGDVTPSERSITMPPPKIEIPKEKIEKIERKPEARVRSRARRVPLLMKEMTGKEKFKIDTAKVLELCDGTNSIEEIAEKTNLPKLKVDMIIKQFEKKGWIKISRVIQIIR